MRQLMILALAAAACACTTAQTQKATQTTVEGLVMACKVARQAAHTCDHLGVPNEVPQTTPAAPATDK